NILVLGTTNFNGEAELAAAQYDGTDAGPVTPPGSPPPPVTHTHFLAVGEDHNQPLVNVYDPTTGTLKFQLHPYAKLFTGGVRVATGDVNGDGVDDIITAAGPGGGPHVKVFDGVTHALITEFMAYNTAFVGGVFVSAADLNGDGRAEVIT